MSKGVGWRWWADAARAHPKAFLVVRDEFYESYIYPNPFLQPMYVHLDSDMMKSSKHFLLDNDPYSTTIIAKFSPQAYKLPPKLYLHAAASSTDGPSDSISRSRKISEKFNLSLVPAAKIPEVCSLVDFSG